MAFLEIPTNSDNEHFDFEIDLEGTVYTLEFKYNKRRDLWTMAILDASENLLLGDIPLLVDVPLLDQYVNENLPPGRFILLDETGEQRDPGRNDLGTTIKLFYDEAVA